MSNSICDPLGLLRTSVSLYSLEREVKTKRNINNKTKPPNYINHIESITDDSECAPRLFASCILYAMSVNRVEAIFQWS